MSFMDQFLWIIYPYLVIAVFILGLLLRYATDQEGWTSKSSQLLEKRLLKWGSMLFHAGIIFVFLGHAAGLLVPLGLYNFFGVPEKQYHIMAAIMGGLSGLAASLGLLILLYRRFFISRIRFTSSTSDVISIILLAIVIFNGMLVTLSHAIDTTGYDYRENLGPWIRGILTFTPNAALMSQVPLIFKIHVISAFAFFAVMPFSRMVHILSQPVTYLLRSFIVYRKRPS